MKLSIFVTVEGCNCPGKSFLFKKFSELLTNKFNIKCATTKQPTEQFDKRNEDQFGRLLLDKIIEDRNYHVNSVLPILLSSNQVVICDRYIESTLVYQRLDYISIEYLWEINRKFPIPDLTIMIHCPEAIRQVRIQQRKSCIRFEGEEYQEIEPLYYMQACRFLEVKGFNYLFIDSTKNEEIDKATESILELLVNSDGG